MPLDDLLLRILGTPIEGRSETDLQELRFIAKDLDRLRNVTGAWIGADGQPNVRSIRADTGIFSIIPIDAMFAFRTTPQSIPDDTVTDISFNLERNSNFFVLDDDDVKIRMEATDSRTIGILGTIFLDNDDAGLRFRSVYFYDGADAFLFSLELHILKPNGTDNDWLPFVGFQSMPFVTTFPRYLKIRCRQTSGGALDMTRCTAALFLMR